MGSPSRAVPRGGGVAITRRVHLLDIEWLLSTLFDASLFKL